MCPHTYILNLLQVVFRTKNREPLIHNLDGLIKNLRGITRNKGILILASRRNAESRAPAPAPPADAGGERNDSGPEANSSRYMSDTSGHFA
jgi:hypothetical protein